MITEDVAFRRLGDRRGCVATHVVPITRTLRLRAARSVSSKPNQHFSSAVCMAAHATQRSAKSRLSSSRDLI